MERWKRSKTWVLGLAIAAAVGAGWVTPRPSLAQYRVDNSGGHALDANNRLGSGGYNTAASNSPTGANSADIFLGNSTGYGNFQGSIPRQPNAFQGYLPIQPSLLLQQAAGVNSPTAAPTYNIPRTFYTYQTAVVAPSGFQSQPIAGVYQATPAPAREIGDYRLGDVLGVVPTSSNNLLNLPGLGQAEGPGAVDPLANVMPDFLNASPLFGAQPLNSQLAGQNYVAGNGVITRTLAPNLTADDIIRLRTELSQSATPWLNASVVGVATTQPTGESVVQPSALTGAISAQPISAQISGVQPLGTTDLSQEAMLAGGAPVAGGFSTGQETRHILPPLPLPPPSEQSSQYAKLRILLQQYQATHPRSDEEATRLFQQALRAQREYEAGLGGAAPTVPLPAPAPAEEPASGTPAPPPTPLDIGSIGQGIHATGLSQLVQDGEDLARHQRFKDAIGKFLDARQVAPNNMLISVDLANAELGAGFYNQAEGYLREAFTADPALLMARYDVKSVIGDDRLQVVIGDLKHIAATGSDATPVFLLAYLSYNTGETDKAVQYLKLAQARAGGQDDLIRSLGDHWSLPTTEPSK